MVKTAALLVLVAVLLCVAPGRAAAAEQGQATVGSDLAATARAAQAPTTAAIVTEARAALAQPEPEPPTPAEVVAAQAPTTPTTPTTLTTPDPDPPAEEIVHGEGAAVLAPALSVDAGTPAATDGAEVLGQQFERSDAGAPSASRGSASPPAANADANTMRAGVALAATGPPPMPMRTADLAAIGLGLVAIGTALTRHADRKRQHLRTRGQQTSTSRATRPGSLRETTPLTPGRTSERGRFRLPY